MRQALAALCFLVATTPALARADAPPPIPDGGIASGSHDIARTWLAEPTERYPHGVLGDELEANALVVEGRDGAISIHRLNDDTVFEFLTPMLADIDGDGLDEAWVVRADAWDGARHEGYGLAAGKLIRRYEGPAIGKGFRWLNPIGIGDFDGDGKAEVAYIETPHIGGVLTVLKSNGDKLEITARAITAYSTHKIGSTSLDLGAIADIDGDGAEDFILPNQVHDRIAVVSLMNGKLVERWRSSRLTKIVSGLLVTPVDSGVRITYRTIGGTENQVTVSASDLTQ
jgi:hypothetical protein